MYSFPKPLSAQMAILDASDLLRIQHGVAALHTADMADIAEAAAYHQERVIDGLVGEVEVMDSHITKLERRVDNARMRTDAAYDQRDHGQREFNVLERRFTGSRNEIHNLQRGVEFLKAENAKLKAQRDVAVTAVDLLKASTEELAAGQARFRIDELKIALNCARNQVVRMRAAVQASHVALADTLDTYK